MHPRTLLVAWCALCWFVVPRAHAEDSDWLRAELAMAERTPTSAYTRMPLASLAATATTSEGTTMERELALGRARTMKAAGYTVATTALAITLATIPLWITRHDHVSYYGSGSCGPNLFPYLVVPAFAGSLATGIIGSRRSREIRSEHPGVSPRRRPLRTTLAGLGAGTAIALLLSTVVGAGICNS